MVKKLTKSLSKFFRTQKAKIRRNVCSVKEQKELITKLYSDKNITDVRGKKNEG